MPGGFNGAVPASISLVILQRAAMTVQFPRSFLLILVIAR